MTSARAHDLQPAADASRLDRDASRDALRVVEDALSAPAPGREAAWLHKVLGALQVLAQHLDAQARRDADPASLLSEIVIDQPRLKPRIDRLRNDHTELRASVDHLIRRLASSPTGSLDPADLRDQLANIARRLRRHRALEADLIYEAVNVNLGVGD